MVAGNARASPSCPAPPRGRVPGSSGGRTVRHARVPVPGPCRGAGGLYSPARTRAVGRSPMLRWSPMPRRVGARGLRIGRPEHRRGVDLYHLSPEVRGLAADRAKRPPHSNSWTRACCWGSGTVSTRTATAPKILPARNSGWATSSSAVPGPEPAACGTRTTGVPRATANLATAARRRSATVPCGHVEGCHPAPYPGDHLTQQAEPGLYEWHRYRYGIGSTRCRSV
jgi:hypothetical protein